MGSLFALWLTPGGVSIVELAILIVANRGGRRLGVCRPEPVRRRHPRLGRANLLDHRGGILRHRGDPTCGRNVTVPFQE